MRVRCRYRRLEYPVPYLLDRGSLKWGSPPPVAVHHTLHESTDPGSTPGRHDDHVAHDDVSVRRDAGPRTLDDERSSRTVRTSDTGTVRNDESSIGGEPSTVTLVVPPREFSHPGQTRASASRSDPCWLARPNSLAVTTSSSEARLDSSRKLTGRGAAGHHDGENEHSRSATREEHPALRSMNRRKPICSCIVMPL